MHVSRELIAHMSDFAIVIPNYNQSHFLPWALESLRHQSAPFNLALMDGGSSDNFQVVADAYSDMITHLESGPDGGQSAAIEKGLEMLTGKIVTWLNADDYYFPDTLQKVSVLFKKYPDLDVLYGDAVHVTKDGFFLCYFPAIQDFNARDLTCSCFICQPACFVRRTAYENAGGINQALRYTMDWDLWCRLARSGAKFRYEPGLLAAVRYYPETKTMSGDWRRYKEIWRIERRYGHRLHPSSWPGFYRFDLASKTKRTFYEKCLLNALDHFRKFKRRFQLQKSGKPGNSLLYGFVRWEPIVKKECTICLPWYDSRPWRELHLRVEPEEAEYRVQINRAPAQTVRTRGGFLSIKMPLFTGNLVKLAISSPGNTFWELSAFNVDLR
ncbi:MAG: glycosyltransferase [Deltaproteobacteria bacterium]|nr:glycosyltransferase [Deltaproteobacteria bacterium]